MIIGRPVPVPDSKNEATIGVAVGSKTLGRVLNAENPLQTQQGTQPNPS